MSWVTSQWLKVVAERLTRTLIMQGDPFFALVPALKVSPDAHLLAFDTKIAFTVTSLLLGIAIEVIQ